MRVPGYWRAVSWVRSYYRSPNDPGVEQLPFPEEVEIPRQRTAGDEERARPKGRPLRR
ncbi:hypothetical protein [Pseudonocardia pini]|uniref:hypothetical protein n=1 Tax=Pseudonocardia pini TaxID=2758030 RepID=UPI0015F104EE|nr:hypothetical protein [Pseudonocardia pini]